ncbi:MAG: hypothetical protein WBM32_00205 [Crocosphaera sp.]
MKWLLRILGWLFFLAAIVSLILYIQGKLAEVIPVATFAALFGVFLSEASKVADKQSQYSKFFLEQSLSGIKYAVELLSDRNNDRGKWISAARTLQQSLEVSKKMTENEHKIILQIELDRYRHQLWQILNPNDENITAAFFYGANDPNLDVHEAAKQSSLPKVGEPQGQLSSLHNLSEQSLFVVWNFMEFPENYADPLRNTFSKGQIEKLRLRHRPLYEYLQHKQTHHSIAGKLYERSDKEE